MFQFPSNGKADPKYKEKNEQFTAKKFQFPSNGKAYPKFKIAFDYKILS